MIYFFKCFTKGQKESNYTHLWQSQVCVSMQLAIWLIRTEEKCMISSNYPIFFSFLFWSAFFSLVLFCFPCLVFSSPPFYFSLWNCDYFKFPVHLGGSIAWGVRERVCVCANVVPGGNSGFVVTGRKTEIGQIEKWAQQTDWRPASRIGLWKKQTYIQTHTHIHAQRISLKWKGWF